MADLLHAFGTFHARIALTSGNRAVIRMAREAIRERIRRYFRDTVKVEIPKFRSQGGYAMGTLVNPINGEYDIDDGVYLQHLDIRSDTSWPAADIVHQWLIDASNGYGRGKAVHRRACVRIRFCGLYHVDLPVYGQRNGRLRLAVKGEPHWPHSDPSRLTKWFGSHVDLHGERLRRIVRYLKAWADFQSMRRGRLPGGLTLTVLAARHFQNQDGDDLALANTFKAISKAVSPVFYVPNPVNINEDLTARLTPAQISRFKDAVNAAAVETIKATTTGDSLRSSIIWQKILGDRFPIIE